VTSRAAPPIVAAVRRDEPGAPGVDELAELEALGRRRGRRVLETAQGARIRLDGREVVSFSSNDYLGLANHAALREAAHEAIDRWGFGAGASRLIVGNSGAHEELEAAVREWLGRPAARVFGSGYAANTGVIATLAGAGDVIFSDELNHASIIDGCRLSRARVRVFRHRDLAHLEALLREDRGRRRIVVSESLFSMDGDVADVAALVAIARSHGAITIVDDAHAIGAMGAGGQGLAGPDVDVVIGTFGKALGGAGAFAACSEPVAELLWNRARPLVFSTAMPPVVAAAATAAIRIVRSPDGDAMRHALRQRVELLGRGVTAIAPVMVGDDRRVMECTQRLLEAGLFVQGIRPPTVPEGTARLRVALSASLEIEDVLRLRSALDELMEAGLVPRGTAMR
jgi:8-amino-7-oxononanoate synthase